ncbi:MAG: 2-hydroxymuconate tautomerase family protein [Candidatus Aminicenantes bacterium]|nr:2-hydroxymuconate tautomerase family protein [Candidatus Aminicenantes bacterium]
MPIVTIQMLEGRDSEQKKELIKKVTESITSTLQIPLERVRVIINEMAFENYGIAGLPVLEYRKKLSAD